MDKISVIIPVYRVEEHLRECVDSVINQTYTNLEIILVDDGSPDSCPQICDEYARADDRVKVIHKPNGGLSSARNAGIDIATGKWIGFVDSDDFIAPNMYEKLYIIVEGCDLAICNYSKVNEESALLNSDNAHMKDEVLTKVEALYKATYPSCMVYYITAWNKLYSSKLFADIRFPEGKLHEDEFIVHHIFDKCAKVATTSECLYMYRQRDGSIMKSN